MGSKLKGKDPEKKYRSICTEYWFLSSRSYKLYRYKNLPFWIQKTRQKENLGLIYYWVCDSWCSSWISCIFCIRHDRRCPGTGRFQMSTTMIFHISYAAYVDFSPTSAITIDMTNFALSVIWEPWLGKYKSCCWRYWSWIWIQHLDRFNWGFKCDWEHPFRNSGIQIVCYSIRKRPVGL